MFYYIRIYIRYIILLLLLFSISLFFFQISKIDGDVMISVLDYTIYTKQNVLVLSFFIFCLISIKFFGLLLNINSSLISFKYKLFEKIEVLKAFFNFKQKTTPAIIKDILHLKRKRLFKVALRVTTENYLLSDKILFWHLFFLLKLGRRREFFRIFTYKPSGRSVRLFMDIYLKKKFKFLRGFLIRKYYFENLDNQVFTYMYALYLFRNGKVKKSRIILMNFLQNKQILMVDFYCSYLMNLLAIKIERALNGSLSDDFTISYSENINKYYESTKKK